MLTFVTSIRHPQNSADFSRVERLLLATLHSIHNQTSSEFSIVIVGNHDPSSDLSGSRVKYLQVDFPAPAPPTGPRTERTPFVWDKGTKIGAGLIAAQEFQPEWIMIIDADDFVHRSLVQFVHQSESLDGWFIGTGYMYSSARGAYRRLDQFNRTCGTCHIVRTSAYGIPSKLAPTASQSEIADAYGDRLWSVLGAHRDGVEQFRGMGVDLQPLPFRGAAYHVDTGENHSGKEMKGLARSVSANFRCVMGLPIEPYSSTPHSRVNSFTDFAYSGRQVLGRLRRNLR